MPFGHMLYPNPFERPPEAVVRWGIGAVKKYFSDFFRDDYIAERRDIKAVIVGEAGSGKTRYERFTQEVSLFVMVLCDIESKQNDYSGASRGLAPV